MALGVHKDCIRERDSRERESKPIQRGKKKKKKKQGVGEEPREVCLMVVG
ncbi:hypothetical protein Syun_015302 [Stephania yunnanensis]|uniref:Uncharacterized protein n=1 Tax=Stephania yunnanensis TaxID=152371 RepID=A0AAP0JL30_9MAGN